MITQAQLLDVLRDHGRRRNIRDIRVHCLCGWVSDLPNGAGEHLRHQTQLIHAAIRAAEEPRATQPGASDGPAQ